MAGKRLLLGAIAFLGIIEPFRLAQGFLDRTFQPDLHGIAAPLTFALPAFGAAFVVALAILVLYAVWALNSYEPTDHADRLDRREELTY